MNKLPCPFRYHERSNGTVATCGLIQQLLRVDDSALCDVPRDACEACCESTPVGSSFVNGVFPSLLNAACSQYLDRSERDAKLTARATELIEISETAVVAEQSITRDRLDSCDVFLCCSDASETTRRSIDSVIQQHRATINLHLILDDPAAEPLVTDYQDAWNVHCHRFPKPIGLFRAVHQLVPHARSEFIALQDPNSVSYPNRIANAVGELERTGGDFVGSPLASLGGDVNARIPTEAFEATIPWPTLVFRRSTYVDIGGFADRDGDQDVELICRAKRSGASVLVLPYVSVEINQNWTAPRIGSPPRYVERFGSLRHHGIGYPHTTVQCDAVMPVYKQLQYAGPAIESIIEQEGAEAIVHLIDDRSPEDTGDLFRYWGSHPRVRLYRNVENVGQYASFNNVSEFFETELVAVQDSDDISLPHRLNSSGNLLRLCDAEFFGASVERFGDATLLEQDRELGIALIRKSFHPFGKQMSYFALNPTACFSVSMFRRLGGYSSFGGSKQKAGLDSEFMSRAYYAGVRFALSSQVVARYRVHDQSATRNKDTGFGSRRRKAARDQCSWRSRLFQSNGFDPKAFGAIGRYRGCTKRIN